MENGQRYKWAVLAIACIGSMMAPLDSSIVSVTLPEMAQGLHMDYVQIIWVPTAYLVTIAALLLSFGRLSDLKGRKQFYLAGFMIFTAASIACSLSQDGNQLIFSRIVQGFGGAFMMAVSPALITAAFPGKERGKALGINAMFIYIGLSIGPPLGGFLTDLYGWPSIFWVNVPIGAVAIIAGALVLKKDRTAIPGRFDITGGLTFAIALISLLIALSFGDVWGWADPITLALLLVSVLSFALFIRIEFSKGEGAMIDTHLFTKNRLFAAGNLSALLNYTSYFGVSIVISFYLQRVMGESLINVGFVLLAMPLTMAIIAPLSGIASDRIGSRSMATTGMVMIAASLLLMSTLDASSKLSDVTIYLIIMGAGMGLFSSPNTSSVMGCVTKEHLGVASGTIATMRVVGQSLSLVVMGAVMTLASSTTVVNAVFGQGGTVPAADFIPGMHAAFIVSSIIALVGAAASFVRTSGRECSP